MSKSDEDDYFDIFPVFCTAEIPVEVLTEFLAIGNNPENEDCYPGGSLYIMKSETEGPARIVRQTQPPVEAFESPFLSWPVKKVFEHFKEKYYEPFEDLLPSEAPKVAGHNCVILDDQACSDGTCLLVSDTPAGDLYDDDLPHTTRCEVRFALSVLGDCEIMNGDLIEYIMNYGDNPDHLLRDKSDEENDAGDGGDDDDDKDDDGSEDQERGEDGDDEGDDEEKGKEVEKEQEGEEEEEVQGAEDDSEQEGATTEDAGHQSKRRKVLHAQRVLV